MSANWPHFLSRRNTKGGPVLRIFSPRTSWVKVSPAQTWRSQYNWCLLLFSPVLSLVLVFLSLHSSTHYTQVHVFIHLLSHPPHGFPCVYLTPSDLGVQGVELCFGNAPIALEESDVPGAPTTFSGNKRWVPDSVSSTVVMDTLFCFLLPWRVISLRLKKPAPLSDCWECCINPGCCALFTFSWAWHVFTD